MLLGIAAVLLLLWLLALTSSLTLGGLAHVPLLLALLAVLVGFVRGRSPVVKS